MSAQQKETRIRNVHALIATAGNPLSRRVFKIILNNQDLRLSSILRTGQDRMRWLQFIYLKRGDHQMILNEVAKCLTRRSLLQHSAAIAAALAHPCMAASDNRSDRPPPRRPINIVGRWRGFNLLEMFSSPIPVPRGSYCFAAGIQRRHVRTDRQRSSYHTTAPTRSRAG